MAAIKVEGPGLRLPPAGLRICGARHDVPPGGTPAGNEQKRAALPRQLVVQPNRSLAAVPQRQRKRELAALNRFAPTWISPAHRLTPLLRSSEACGVTDSLRPHLMMR